MSAIECTHCARPLGVGEAQYLDALRQVRDMRLRAERAEAEVRALCGHPEALGRQRPIDRHLGRLLLSDLRYSMGRCSTAPWSCSEGIRELWSVCDAAHRRFMLRDLREQFAMWERTDRLCPGVLGDKCDVETWSDLLAWMEAQP